MLNDIVVSFHLGILCLKGLGFIILMMSQQCGSGRGKATLEPNGMLFA
jgi:hypothetical protein